MTPSEAEVWAMFKQQTETFARLVDLVEKQGKQISHLERCSKFLLEEYVVLRRQVEDDR